MKKRDENSQLEMLEDGKSMGAGAATIVSAGAAVAIGFFLFKNPLKALFTHIQPAPEPISFAEELGINNVQKLTPEQYIDEIASLLEFKFVNHGIERLPVGHSWTELAQNVISSINPGCIDSLLYLCPIIGERAGL